MDRFKVRIRFRKEGVLRLLSHLDLMRCWERMLRRAEIPFCSTSGFHPQPRIVFALSLSLGTVGLQEIVEIELSQPLSESELHERLRRVAPPGLTCQRIEAIPLSRSAQPVRALYRFPLPTPIPAHLPAAIDQLRQSDELWVLRTRPSRKRVDIRPYLRSIRLEEASLWLDLWVTPSGSAKAEEFIDHLGLSYLFGEGAILERTELHVRDEVSAEELPPPSVLQRRTAEVDSADLADRPSPDESAFTTSVSEWGASPNGPVVE